MDNLINKLKPKSEFIRNVLTLMTGTTIAQAIPIAISPILTRIYTPEDFGVFAFFVSIVGLFSVISALGYEQSIFLPKHNKYAINIFILSFVIISLITLVLFLTIYILKNNILLGNSTIIYNWLYFIPFTVFFIGLFNLLSNYNNRIKNYKDIAIATVIKSISLTIIQIFIGLFKNGPSGLILGQIFAQFFANIKLLRNIIKDKVLLSCISILKVIAVFKRYKNFPKYYMPHSLLNTISASLPIYFFTPLFGSKIVGFYSLALMITLTPIMIIANSISKVYNQRIAEIYNNGLDTYLFTVNIIKQIIKITIIPFICIVLLIPSIIGIIFGYEWTEVGIYIQLLSPFIFIVFIVSIIAYLPSLYQKQHKALMIEIIYLLLKLVSLYLGCVVYENVYIALGLFSSCSVFVLGFNLKWFIKLTKQG